VQQHGSRGQMPPTGDPVATHRELEVHMQREVGTTTRVAFVQPHPRLSRLVCLWAGRRRATPTRQHFKRQLTKRECARGKWTRAKASSKWEDRNADAAAGLEHLHWRKIRRIVGLTPWGAQLIFRLKHNALSTYDPITAGIHCPHATCGRAGRVDLYHVFWECPAALQLRTLLLSRWASAGLRLAKPEHAFFSLALDAVPQGILLATGRNLADCLDSTIGALGGIVERITAQCWSLDVREADCSIWPNY